MYSKTKTVTWELTQQEWGLCLGCLLNALKRHSKNLAQSGWWNAPLIYSKLIEDQCSQHGGNFDHLDN